MLTARDPEKGEQAVQLLKDEGLNPVFKQLDIGDRSSVEVSPMTSSKRAFLRKG